jgi:hypothetical protein
LRGELVAAFCDPGFIAVASRLTGGFLRQVVADRLKGTGVDIVVVAAQGLGSDDPPFREAEIVWQPTDGGEFERLIISWDLARWVFAGGRESGRVIHFVVDCPACRQRNDLSVDERAQAEEVACAHCGANLGTVSDFDPRSNVVRHA